MKTYLDCVPCFIKQTLDACRMATSDENVHASVIRDVLRKAADMSFDESPPHMGMVIHRAIRQACNNPDPYQAVKDHFNQTGLDLLPELRGKIERSDDALDTAVRIAIAGNIIDFGVTGSIDDALLHHTLQETLTILPAINDMPVLREQINGSDQILYLADNAGEIAFDRLLIEHIGPHRITLAVKKSPVINDATVTDAEAVGLSEMVRVVDNGSDAPGTILDMCSSEFRKLFNASELVIAKGQGNYETLNNVDHNIFFLLKAKCPVIAAELNVSAGSVVIKGPDTERPPILYESSDIDIGYHPQGFRIDKTAEAMNRYTRWNIEENGKWKNPEPVCFHSLPENGWHKTESFDWNKTKE